MFKKTAASLRIAAVKAECQAEQAMAKVQASQVQALKQNQLASELETQERIDRLEQGARLYQMAYQRAHTNYVLAIAELTKAQDLVDATAKQVETAASLRQAASLERKTAYDKVAMAKNLKKDSAND